MTSVSYLISSLEYALDEVGISATSEQITAIAKSLEGSLSVEYEMTGQDCIPDPRETELREVKARYQREIDHQERLRAGVEALALRARGLRPDQAYVHIETDGTAHFEERR